MMKLYYNGKPTKVLVFRVFSKCQNRGIKLYMSMNAELQTQKKSFEFIGIKRFDE